MCGIAGYVGLSQKYRVSYELITSLFECSELRGIDASGVWGTDIEEKVVYHKLPIRSGQFVKTRFWHDVRKMRTDLLLVHARAASKGSEHARINANNHPFVSSDKQIGMIHNGCIDEAEFLKEKYEVCTDTDSEVLLRMYEHGSGSEIVFENRLNGIKDVWATVSEGAMAVAVGERFNKDCKTLFLFRNEKRPLWIADLRSTLGQVFFFSSLDVWYRALNQASQGVKDAVENQPLIEIPTKEIWNFSIISSELSWRKYDVKIEDNGKLWKHEGEKLKIKDNKGICEVVTNLKEQDVVDSPPPLVVIPEPIKPELEVMAVIDRQNNECNGYSDDDPAHMYIGQHDLICERIAQLARDIDVATSNSCMENTMSPSEYQGLIESLEQTKLDLEGTLEIIGN